MSEVPAVDTWAFKRGALTYPQPVAFACGRLLRASQPQERVDACLKAAEVLSRYLAALAIGSLRSRSDGEFPASITPLSGNLSFGHFLSVVQEVAKVDGHPLQPYLSPFRPKGKGRKRARGKADEPLVALLELRNQLGHDLTSLSRAGAITILRQQAPHQLLIDALDALEGVLGLPLFVFDNLALERKRIVAQRLLLMGESPDPIPDRIELLQALDSGVPYVAFGQQALALPPSMLFTIIEAQSAYRLAFLDAVLDGRLRYKTLESDVFHEATDHHAELAGIFGGETRAVEEVRLTDGSTMPKMWGRERLAREEAGRRTEGRVPWDGYSAETLSWYASRLPGDDAPPRDRLTAHLLDGREAGFSEDELRQLSLLFGEVAEVRTLLGREMSDLRSVSDAGGRWDERIVGSHNVLDTLVASIEFFAQHVGLDRAEARDLAKTEGTADYIAMREALVNQFIHQDYRDPTAAAQVELGVERAVFFNTGHSLVTQEHLTEGGKSQARNPLIARALRLIGFAELAGSGIRALENAWREAHRRPPRVESDQVGNSFTLILDWRVVPNAYDEVWKSRIGVQLNPTQAAILNLATAPEGITEQQAAAGAGVSLAEAREALRYLVKQVLVCEVDNRFQLEDHLREVLE